MIVMIDNYDSFTFNVVDLFASITREPIDVVRNDAFEPDALLAQHPKAILVSPGPGDPQRAGRVLDLIRASAEVPLLGICLGHQAIGAAFGAGVVRGPEPVHGKRFEISHSGEDLFEGVPERIVVTRYHSLVVDHASIPESLVIDAQTDDGVVMAMHHRTRPLYGVQFHPESYGSECGDAIARNFLRIGGIHD